MIFFLVSFFGLIFLSQWISLNFFAPFLILSLQKHSLFNCLIRSLCLGILFDLFSSATFFGETSILYMIIVAILYTQRHNFFEEKLTTLPVLTFVFSFLFSVFSSIFHFFFQQDFAYSYPWLFSDLLAHSFADSLFALILFSLPFHLREIWLKMRLKRRIHMGDSTL